MLQTDRMGDDLEKFLEYSVARAPRLTLLQSGRMDDNQRLRELLTKQVDINTELVNHLAELFIEPAVGRHSEEGEYRHGTCSRGEICWSWYTT